MEGRLKWWLVKVIWIHVDFSLGANGRHVIFFEWWQLEDDYEFSEDDGDGVTSRLNISEIEQSSINFVHEDQYLERNKLDELKVSVVGLRSVVKMLLFLVVLLVLIVVFKWLYCLNEMHFSIVKTGISRLHLFLFLFWIVCFLGI